MSERRGLGRYEILGEIGRGGMAIVHLARQIDLGRLVALKELSAVVAGDTYAARRFVRESRLAGSLNHPNIVTVHDFFEDHATPYIAMEYVERGSLRPVMADLGFAQIAGVLDGLLAGLAHAHAPLEDLVQVASVGLLKALGYWDPKHGAPLAGYAIPTIIGELRRHFRDRTWLVRPPRALQDLALAVHSAGECVAQTAPRADVVSALAARLERREDEVREAMIAIAARLATPHDARNADGDETPGVLELAAEPDAGYARVEHAMLLDDLLAALDERAREVVRLSFHDDLLQREIAERIGCSQMHVSRILRAALNRMRLHAGFTVVPSGA